MIVEDRIYQTIVDSTDVNNVYYGYADLGRATTEEVWRIKKKTTAGAIVTEMYPIGTTKYPVQDFSFKWSERDHYNYSLAPDFVVPTLSTVTIASNNSTTTLAKVGDVVTITVISSEAINTPVATIGAGSATAVLGADELNWTLTRTMTSADVNGVVTFSIAFSDKGGTFGTAVTAVTGGASVTFDKLVPTITTATMASNNTTTTLAKTGDEVTLTIVASESLKTKPTITIAGHAIDGASVTQGGDASQWSVVYTMAGGDTNGLVPFTINGFDLAGNALVEVSTLTGGVGVTFDKTVPVLDTVSIVSDNVIPTIAMAGDTITVTVIAHEALKTKPTFNIATHAIAAGSVTMGVDNKHWTATYDMVGGDTTGNVPFTIDGFDLAGNALVQVTATTDASAVTFDKTAPVFTITSITSDNVDTARAKVNDTVTMTCSVDAALGANPTAKLGTKAMTYVSKVGLSYTFTRVIDGTETQGASPCLLTGTDLAGNTTTDQNIGNIAIDYTKPTATLTYSKDAGVTYTNTISVKDADVLRILATINEAIKDAPVLQISIDNAVLAATNMTKNTATEYYYDLNVPAGDIGVATCSVGLAVDLAGNVINTVATQNLFQIDNTVPSLSSVTIVSDNADNKKAKTGDTITLSFTADAALVSKPTVTIATHAIDSSAVTGTPTIWTATYDMVIGDSEGAVPFTIDGFDLAGNALVQVIAVTSGGDVTFNKTAPTASTVTMASNNTDTAKAKVGDTITLTIITNEDTKNVIATLNGNAMTEIAGIDAQHWTATYIFQSSDTNGAVTFTLDFDDLFGNAATQVTIKTGGDTVIFDKTAPTISSVSDNSVTELEVTLDSLAIQSTLVKANDGGWRVSETGQPLTSYAVTATDHGATDDKVVLTVDDMTASAAGGVTVTYIVGGNGTVADLTGNLLATNATGVATGAF